MLLWDVFRIQDGELLDLLESFVSLGMERILDELLEKTCVGYWDWLDLKLPGSYK